VLSSAVAALTEADTAEAISTSGQLTISDVDSPATFIAQSDVAGTYGTFAVGASGAVSVSRFACLTFMATGSDDLSDGPGVRRWTSMWTRSTRQCSLCST
jgi:hypothetical protein